MQKFFVNLFIIWTHVRQVVKPPVIVGVLLLLLLGFGGQWLRGQVQRANRPPPVVFQPLPAPSAPDSDATAPAADDAE